MVAFEMMLLLTISVIAVVTIAAVGRPFAEAYSEKLKARYREMESETEKNLKDRLSTLEEDMREVKRQLTGLEESKEFILKLGDTEDSRSSMPSSKSKPIDTKAEKKK